MRCSNASSLSNRYESLADSDDEVSTENNERKAKKKLKEIERLEKKKIR